MTPSLNNLWASLLPNSGRGEILTSLRIFLDFSASWTWKPTDTTHHLSDSNRAMGAHKFESLNSDSISLLRKFKEGRDQPHRTASPYRKLQWEFRRIFITRFGGSSPRRAPTAFRIRIE
ncbi:hypothetical protein TWF225_007263 [Orbilia oligospora]|uniref:Uncharacterized protein n=1 Tax=Orbilia oligospora TaxID=2813651 RepID=A0A8H2E5W5_ORBOL|nr:hypothetical protein TWF225_007263 [Orbilia oligospora]KAF3239639.1 hypothetical protein TWF128_011741 [Orbilia oligospora]KAF3255403.1 hypothetical protein TWF217_006577 [Orbilia oligospora]KAF3295707.1 hypothetical protein TWF132_001033 [Orbilia oligospora]TGJ71468.1 hypothetical protein EYR41_003430 [Orbilia oligospora]